MQTSTKIDPNEWRSMTGTFDCPCGLIDIFRRKPTKVVVRTETTKDVDAIIDAEKSLNQSALDHIINPLMTLMEDIPHYVNNMVSEQVQENIDLFGAETNVEPADMESSEGDSAVADTLEAAIETVSEPIVEVALTKKSRTRVKVTDKKSKKPNARRSRQQKQIVEEIIKEKRSRRVKKEQCEPIVEETPLIEDETITYEDMPKRRINRGGRRRQ